MPKKQNTRKPQSRTQAQQAEAQYRLRQGRRQRVLRVIGALFGALVIIALVLGVIASNIGSIQ